MLRLFLGSNFDGGLNILNLLMYIKLFEKQSNHYGRVDYADPAFPA